MERTGASRSAQFVFVAPWRLAPAAYPPCPPATWEDLDVCEPRARRIHCLSLGVNEHQATHGQKVDLHISLDGCWVRGGGYHWAFGCPSGSEAWNNRGAHAHRHDLDLYRFCCAAMGRHGHPLDFGSGGKTAGHKTQRAYMMTPNMAIHQMSGTLGGVAIRVFPDAAHR